MELFTLIKDITNEAIMLHSVLSNFFAFSLRVRVVCFLAFCYCGGDFDCFWKSIRKQQNKLKIILRNCLAMGVQVDLG